MLLKPYIIRITLAIFIIGTTATINTEIIPIVPPTLLITLVAPTTVSKLSEKNFPTTGTKLDTAACVVFTAKESTEEVRVVSSDNTPKKM